jgi:hypothetical protein
LFWFLGRVLLLVGRICLFELLLLSVLLVIRLLLGLDRRRFGRRWCGRLHGCVTGVTLDAVEIEVHPAPRRTTCDARSPVRPSVAPRRRRS